MLLRCIAIIGLLGVALGAMGAHWVANIVTEREFKTYQTAVWYHQLYSVVMLCLELLRLYSARNVYIHRYIVICFLVATIIFSGSLYAYLITGNRWFVHITPIGGIGLMMGWAWIGWQTWSYYYIPPKKGSRESSTLKM